MPLASTLSPSRGCAPTDNVLVSGRFSDVGLWQIVLKKSKVERLRQFREDRFLLLSAVESLSRTATKVLIAFVGIDVVPNIAAHGMHQRG
jgi:hypothetical protein